MEFSTMYLHFKGTIDFVSKEISYMKFLKLKYNDNTSKEDVCDIFGINFPIEEKIYIENVHVVALFVTVRNETYLVAIGTYYPDKWISDVLSGIKKMNEVKKEFYC